MFTLLVARGYHVHFVLVTRGIVYSLLVVRGYRVLFIGC